MRNLHITSGTKGANDPNNPKFHHMDTSPPKDTTAGRDLMKGYDCVYPPAEVPGSARNSRNK